MNILFKSDKKVIIEYGVNENLNTPKLWTFHRVFRRSKTPRWECSFQKDNRKYHITSPYLSFDIIKNKIKKLVKENVELNILINKKIDDDNEYADEEEAFYSLNKDEDDYLNNTLLFIKNMNDYNFNIKNVSFDSSLKKLIHSITLLTYRIH